MANSFKIDMDEEKRIFNWQGIPDIWSLLKMKRVSGGFKRGMVSHDDGLSSRFGRSSGGGNNTV